jgi:prepilin-type N-terminal cleavage/methylation domain-containing protein/prepilin-type processing-associated H-X9-DG protein
MDAGLERVRYHFSGRLQLRPDGNRGTERGAPFNPFNGKAQVMRHKRQGFTLVELLVVIAIIGTLVALLLPAVQSARETARGNTCRNNIKQLQLALTSYDTTMGRLPGYTNELYNPNAQKVSGLIPATEGRRASWVVMTFPHIEQVALWDSWSTKFGAGVNPPVAAIEMLFCPSDLPEVPSEPWCSYVGNCGMAISDTSSNNDKKDNAGDGVFVDDNKNINFGPTPGDGREADRRQEMSLGRVADGTSKTFMISENNHAWYWSYGINDAKTIRDTKHLFGFVWKNFNPPSQPSAIERLNGDRYHEKNTPPTTMEAFAAVSPYESYGFPTSNHPSSVNFAFCDGHITSIADSINPVVYGQLCTSNRMRSRLIDYSGGGSGVPERSMTPPADNAY